MKPSCASIRDTWEVPKSRIAIDALVAFYADCRHEVRPAKQGYRVVLTYNLMIKSETATAPPAAPVDALVLSVRDFFEAAPESGQAVRAATPPDRLVYLLDHEYTKRGLAWNRLKNALFARGASRSLRPYTGAPDAVKPIVPGTRKCFFFGLLP